jgi:hypothetical protein
MWPVIRRTSVPPTEMSKDHRPHPNSPTGGVARPGTSPVGAPPQLNKLDPSRSSPSGVPRRCTVVA